MLYVEKAPAKLNLSLLVTDKREDSYHTLSSFVTFTDFGDEIHFEPADRFSFEMTGSFAHMLPQDESNLCVRAYHLVKQVQHFKIKLVKNMPISSGMGGGSADSAAVLRGLKHFGAVIDEQKLVTLGADVPACYYSKPVYMSGRGEKLAPLSLPRFHVVLVNPLVAVSTPVVFNARKGPYSSPVSDFPEDITQLKNDLELPAQSLFPVITDVLQLLSHTKDCKLARLSGSGATCFGVYPDAASAKLAEKRISEENPAWWTMATTTIAS